MHLKQVGFFRELKHGSPDGPPLQKSIQRATPPDEDLIVQYLESGSVVAATGSLTNDVLDPSKKGVAPLEIATDGEWVWPLDLPYYVRTYHVQLPMEFIEHMRRRHWRPRSLTSSELEMVESDYLSQSI